MHRQAFGQMYGKCCEFFAVKRASQSTKSSWSSGNSHATVTIVGTLCLEGHSAACRVHV